MRYMGNPDEQPTDGESPVLTDPTASTTAFDGDPRHAADGDARARFEAVYRRRWADLVRLGFLIVGSRAVAEELTQDAFARLLPRLDQVDNPDGFLHTTLVRLCSTWLSRRGMEEGRLGRIGEPAPLGDHQLDDTWAALDRLRPERRTVLVLRYYQDLPIAEIATLVGCPPATVRTRLHRGLADLRKVLDR
jgi:RNA polymerase sigma factor (sigma-70 family)